MFSSGKAISVPPLRAIYIISPSEHILQCGFTISAKHFKKAVDRNRIKRLMREAYRLQKKPLEALLEERQQHLSLFIIYTVREIQDQSLITEKMSQLLERLIKNISVENFKSGERL